MTYKKLNKNQVRLIRHLHGQGDLSYRELAVMFKVSHAQIRRIVSRVQRADVPDWVSEDDIRRYGKAAFEEAAANLAERLPTRQKLSDIQVNEIRERYELEPVTMQALAKDYGVSQRHICRLINREQRKDI